jgi:hypothetical protein
MLHINLLFAYYIHAQYQNHTAFAPAGQIFLLPGWCASATFNLSTIHYSMLVLLMHSTLHVWWWGGPGEPALLAGQRRPVHVPRRCASMPFKFTTCFISIYYSRFNFMHNTRITLPSRRPATIFFARMVRFCDLQPVDHSLFNARFIYAQHASCGVGGAPGEPAVLAGQRRPVPLPPEGALLCHFNLPAPEFNASSVHNTWRSPVVGGLGKRSERHPAPKVRPPGVGREGSG